VEELKHSQRVEHLCEMDQVKKIWAENGYPSAAKLWSIIRQQGLHLRVTRQQIVDYIAGQSVSQLQHKQPKAKYSHITTTAPGLYYNADLLDMSAYSRQNSGISWI